MGIMMDEISKQIEEMAEKMEKSNKDPKDSLFAVIKALGAKGLKAKVATLSDSEKLVLKAALEELTLKKAVSFDAEAQSAKPIQGKLTDTVIQEEIASDDADEKLVKPAAATMNHQGTPTDGWEGQVIKSLQDNEEQLNMVIEKAMEKCKDDKMVMKKLKEKGMDEKKVQGALDNYKAKKEVKKSEDAHYKREVVDGKETNVEITKSEAEDLEKGKMKDEAAKKIMAMEEKEHGIKDPKKLVEAEKEEHKKEKMKKSLTWGDDNQLLKANTLGRNFNFNVGEFIEKTLASEPSEDLSKSSSKDGDLNDLIKKGEDRSWTQIRTEAQVSSSKTNGTLVKSFEDNEIASILGLSEEEAKKILG